MRRAALIDVLTALAIAGLVFLALRSMTPRRAQTGSVSDIADSVYVDEDGL